MTSEAYPSWPARPAATPAATPVELHRARPSAYPPPEGEPTVIDCDRCSMRGIGCGDCVVTVLLGGPPYGVELDDDERHAIDVLAQAGLVPPLRMVEALDTVHIHSE